MAQDINRLKVVLAEKKRTNKWLSEQVGKDPATVSKWCTNIGGHRKSTLCRCKRSFVVDKKMKYMIIKHSLSNVVNKIV